MISTRLADEQITTICTEAMNDLIRSASDPNPTNVAAYSSRSVAGTNLVLIELQMRYLDMVAGNILKTEKSGNGFGYSQK